MIHFTAARRALAAGAVLLAAAPALAQDGYFAGRSIDVIVPFGPGGATYVSAKTLEPFMEKHLPGAPEVNVIDRPGGGSILGANWFHDNARADGTTVLFTTSSSASPYILGQREVAYDLAAYRVAYSHPFGQVTYVAPSVGAADHMALKAADARLIYGGIGAAASDLPTLLSFELLGMDVATVLGFNGRGPARLAFERGETNIDFQFTPVYLTQVVPSVEAGSSVPLWSGGAIGEDGALTARDPVFPDLPSVHEVYVDWNGAAPEGVVWDAYETIATITYAFGLTGYLHADAPQEAVDAFAEGVAAMNADPEFQQAMLQVTGGAPLAAGPDVEAAVRRALQPDDSVKAYLRDHLAEKYDVRF